MISFAEIADRLEERKGQYGSYRDVKFEEDWKPERCTDFVVPPFKPFANRI